MKGAVGCDEASLRIVTEVSEEWKDIVDEYCMTKAIIKEQGLPNSIAQFDFLAQTVTSLSLFSGFTLGLVFDLSEGFCIKVTCLEKFLQ